MLKRDTLYYRKLKKDICVTDNNGGMFEYKFNDCVAIVAEGEDKDGRWMTIYQILTWPESRNKGDCQGLLKALKKVTQDKGARLAIWCPMNEIMDHICKKLNIEVV